MKQYLSPEVIPKVEACLKDAKKTGKPKSIDDICSEIEAKDDLPIIHAINILIEKGKATHAGSRKFYDSKMGQTGLQDTYTAT